MENSDILSEIENMIKDTEPGKVDPDRVRGHLMSFNTMVCVALLKHMDKENPLEGGYSFFDQVFSEWYKSAVKAVEELQKVRNNEIDKKYPKGSESVHSFLGELLGVSLEERLSKYKSDQESSDRVSLDVAKETLLRVSGGHS